MRMMKKEEIRFYQFGLRYRFSDKFNVNWSFNPSFSNNETGFAGKTVPIFSSEEDKEIPTKML
jgi:hypothetical protein